MLFKKRINIDEMSKALYTYTTDKVFFENAFNILDRKNTIDRNIIKRELMFLTIITVDYFLRSQKIQRRYGRNAKQLMVSFLSHFKNQTDKKGTSDTFINLLDERANCYNNFIETDNASAITHFPMRIAEQLQKYCGVENDPLFMIGVMKIFDVNFKTLQNKFDKFKIVN